MTEDQFRTPTARRIPYAIILRHSIAACLCALLVVLSAKISTAAVVLVNRSASGIVQDGRAWDTAFLKVQAGINAAAAGDEVWVAEGTYVERITLKDGVALYGGFAGTETTREQRDFLTHLSTLNGDSEGVVVTVPPGATDSTIIDGFTVTKGYGSSGGGIVCTESSPVIANNYIYENDAAQEGAGIHCIDSSPRIAHNAICYNVALYGGGIFCVGGSPTIVSNAIIDNYAEQSGGGIYSESSAIISSNTIEHNYASYSGGIAAWTAETVANNTIKFNTAMGIGGGVACSADVVVANNVIAGNAATWEAGGIWCEGSVKIFNNTIASNSADQGGGAIDCAGSPRIANNIIALNSSGIRATADSSPQANNNCFYENTNFDRQGISAAPGDIEADPRLARRDFCDLHIQPDSPCINAGDDSVVLPEWVDMDRSPRLRGEHVDIGADESDGTVWEISPRIVRVSNAGDNANEGDTWQSTKRTIQAAVDALYPAGGEVWLKTGTYYEQIALPTLVYIYGGFSGTETDRSERTLPATQTIIDGSKNGTMRIGAVEAVEAGYLLSGVDSVTIRGYYSNSSGGGVACFDSSPIISNSIISGNRTYKGGGVFCVGGCASLRNCTITGNTGTYQGGGVYSFWAAPSITNCVIDSNTTNPGSAIFADGAFPVITNNTITRYRNGIYLMSEASPTVANNIIAFNTSCGVRCDPAKPGAPDLHNNCVFGNGPADYSGLNPGDGDIALDPLFVNRAGRDYHLTDNSPCVDAGSDTHASTGWLDLDSLPRIFNAHVDMGADEHDPGLPDTTPPDTSITSCSSTCSLPITVQWRGTDNRTSPEFLLFSFRLDGEEWTDFTAATSFSYLELSEGQHALRVRARDEHGNVDPYPAVWVLTVELNAPVISNVRAEAFGTQAVITWETNHPADSQVDYGKTVAYTSAWHSSSKGTSHATTITGLSPGATYHYRVRSRDSCSRESVSDDLQFTVPMGPDLVPSSVSGPAQASTGQAIEVTWTVRNAGVEPAVGPWSDKVFLSSDRESGNDIVLGQFAYQNDLLPGEQQVRTQSVVVPSSIVAAGTYYLQVVTDADKRVNEGVGETNNYAVSDSTIAIARSPRPDLIVSQVTLPTQAWAGQTVRVTWSVKNESAVATDAGYWTDRLYLSTDAIVNSSDKLLGDVPNGSYLGPGESYTESMEFALGTTQSGPYYVLVTTDLKNNLDESSEQNNQGCNTAAMQVKLPPPPDLQVSSVNAPISAIAGMPMNVSWSVRNVGNGPALGSGWTDSIYLSADATFNQADRLVGTCLHSDQLNPGGSYEASKDVGVPDGFSGPYFVFVITDSTNAVNEQQWEGGNIGLDPTPVNITYPPPDLEVVALEAPETVRTGQTVSVRWTAKNYGPGAINSANWTDNLYLSSDEVFQPTTDRLLATVAHSGTLDVDATYEAAAAVTIPNDMLGPQYLLVAVDSLSKVPEYDETNNTTSKAVDVSLTMCDLRVTQVMAPRSARVRQPISITWNVTNAGADAAVAEAWTDRVYLSSDEQLGQDILLGSCPHTGSLAAGQSYTQVQSFVIPEVEPRIYYVFVKTDALNQVAEPEGETNNGGRDVGTLDVLWSQVADLRVTQLQAPTNGASGSPAQINWTVRNLGDTSTATGTWKDTVYLSKDQKLDTKYDTQLGSFTHIGVLTPGGSYSRSESTALPAKLQGSYYVFVFTDSGNAVNEPYSEGNNWLFYPQPLQITLSPWADLQVKSVAAPTSCTFGSPLAVSWNVRNAGGGATLESAWSDRVYLSKDQIPDYYDILLGKVPHSGVLAAGGDYTASGQFTVPQGTVGAYYVWVKADSEYQVFENGFDTNDYVSPTPVQITAPPLPDLRVTAVTGPRTAISGQPMPISWTVTNAGTGATAAAEWHDAAYLSKDLLLDSSDLKLGYLTHASPVQGDASYTAETQFEIPGGVSGQYHMLVYTDSTNAVYEYDAEKNNTAADLEVTEITFSYPVDLVVGRVEAPGSAAPGTAAAINFTIANQGANAAAGVWHDAVYLSADDTWSIDDVLLGRVEHSGTIEGSSSYDVTLNAIIPGVTPSQYRVLVRADVRNAVREDSEGNNTGVSPDWTSIDTTVLTLGVPTAGQLTSGLEHYYRVDVPADSILRVKLDGQSTYASNELYLRYGAMPDRGSYDYLYPSPFMPDQEIIAGETLGGWYYAMVRGDYVPSPPENYTITATVPGLDIRAISPARCGDVGNVTILIDGNKFTDSTVFEIVDGSGGVFPAVKTRVLSSVRALVTFGLTGATRGLASIRLTDGPRTAMFDGGLTIEPTRATTASTWFEGPDQLRAGELGIWYLNYANTGNVDADVPVFLLKADGATQLVTKPNGKNLGTCAFVLGMPGHPLLGVLRPGEQSAIPLYVRMGTAAQVVLTAATPEPGTLGDYPLDYDWLTKSYSAGWASYVNDKRSEWGDTLGSFYDGVLSDLAGYAENGRYDSAQHVSGRWLFDINMPGPGAPVAPIPTLRLSNVSDPEPITRPADGFVDTYVVVVDIHNYSDWRDNGANAPDLLSARDNADAVCDYFRKAHGVPVDHVTRLQGGTAPGEHGNREVTPHDVAHAIRHCGADGDDKLVVYYAGHAYGVASDQGEIAPDPMNGTWLLSRQSLTAAQVRDALDTSGAGTCVVIVESSLSGEFGRQVSAANTVVFASTDDRSVSCAPVSGRSPFTAALLRNLDESGSWGQSFARARIQVADWLRGHLSPDMQRLPMNQQNPTLLPGSVLLYQGWGGEIGNDFWGHMGAGMSLPPSATKIITRVGSIDPNEMVGPSGYGEERFVSVQQPIRYRVSFENVATATAPAQRIRITNQLDPNLDWRTFRLAEVSFGDHNVAIPENRSCFQGRVPLGEEHSGLLADVSAMLDIRSGSATWTLTAVDPATGEQPRDPLLGLLPPNDDDHAGEGYVVYTVRPKAGLATGAVVRNSATIVFDNNEPIVTNVVTNTIDAAAPASSVGPMPAEQPTTFAVNWSGSDDAAGSGVQDYDVFVSDDGGPWTQWQSGLTDTSAEFKGRSGHTYKFYSTARDNAGMLEKAASAEDAFTTVKDPAPSEPTPADGSTGIAVRVALGWTPGSGAATHDLYLWKEGEPRPSSPTATGLASVAFQPPSGLSYGTTYRWQVAAVNGVSAVAGSEWTFTTENAPMLLGPGDAKRSADGTLVSIQGVVSAVFADAFYLESRDRCMGIRVSSDAQVAVGMTCTVVGRLGTTADYERQILATDVIIGESVSAIQPLLVAVWDLGGAGFGCGAAGTGQRGLQEYRLVEVSPKHFERRLADMAGLNNIGLLIRACGKIVAAADGGFYLDDGSGTDDGDPAVRGVRLSVPSGAAVPAPGSTVRIDGISSCYKIAEHVFRLLRVQKQSDIVVLQ